MSALPWQLLEWREPFWLLLATQPLILLLLRQVWRWRHPSAFAQASLLPWVRRQDARGVFRRLWSRTTAHVLAWLLLALAAAGPRLPEELPGQNLRDGARVLVALDLSRSMEAADVSPTRFKRARIELLDLLDRARVDRFGLLPFAGRAHLLAPPSADYDALRHYLDGLRPNLLPTAGSGIGAALEHARGYFAEAPGADAAVLLISDGEAADGQQARAAAEALAKAGIPLYVLGVGSAEGASLPANDGGWLEQDGRAVVSRLDATTLRRLAELTGGRYADVADDDSDWQRLYEAGIATLTSHRIAEHQAKRIYWHELHAWVLIPGLFLLAVSLFPLGRRTAPALVLLLVAAAPCGHQSPAAAADRAVLERTAHGALEAGRYVAAREAYGRLPGYTARMGEGAAAYRMGDSGHAAVQFTQAILDAENDDQRARAIYNLGNSQFQRGDYSAAADAYRDALRYREAYPSAEVNLALAEDLLEAVQAELARSAPPGRGPRPGEAEADADGGRFIMDPEDMPPPNEEQALPELPGGGDRELAALIARGVRHARRAGGDATRSTRDGEQGVDPGTVAAARAHARRLQPDTGDYWRGLFSFEEGFPAPVTEPRPLPGAAPW